MARAVVSICTSDGGDRESRADRPEIPNSATLLMHGSPRPPVCSKLFDVSK